MNRDEEDAIFESCSAEIMAAYTFGDQNQRIRVLKELRKLADEIAEETEAIKREVNQLAKENK